MTDVLVIALGVLLALAGVAGLASPRRLRGVMLASTRSGRWILAVAALRIGVGALLLAVADGSRYPTALGVLGVLSVIGGLVAWALAELLLTRLGAPMEVEIPLGLVALAAGYFGVHTLTLELKPKEESELKL